MASKRNIEIYNMSKYASQTRVAEQFGLSQPTVSGIIRKVEKELIETGKIKIESETKYPYNQGGFWASDQQNAHIEAMTAQHGSYSAAMRQIINRSLSITNTTKQE